MASFFQHPQNTVFHICAIELIWNEKFPWFSLVEASFFNQCLQNMSLDRDYWEEPCMSLWVLVQSICSVRDNPNYGCKKVYINFLFTFLHQIYNTKTLYVTVQQTLSSGPGIDVTGLVVLSFARLLVYRANLLRSRLTLTPRRKLTIERRPSKKTRIMNNDCCLWHWYLV